ncbi:recombinase family protein [Streptomyces sp. NPDC002599]|uniref:recombinase family protein n=1 Tax=Streptomyces sp. NPDC002599 TaxID=3154421 RepID=UPI00331E13C0
MASTTLRTTTDVVTAREYRRVSKGKGKVARSLDRQHAENLNAADEHGPWTWGAPYLDTGSASKYATKSRDGFDGLMADLESGAFGEPGDILVLWEISRLSREMEAGNRIIKLCERRSYLIHVTSEGHTFDPRNYGDYDALNRGILDAEKEARRLSARTTSGIHAAAREGRPHGRIPFGYARDYEASDGKPRAVRQYPHPTEGPLVRELFERVAGDPEQGVLPEPIYAIAQDWAERGIVLPEKGEDGEPKPYTPQHLRAILVRPVYAGLRKYNGTVLPEWEGMEPVVSGELWDRVQAVLADPSRKTYQGGGLRWVLSGTLVCDACDGPMHVKVRSGVAGYECKKNACCRIPQAEADRVLIGDLDAGELGVIIAYLSDPHQYERLTRPSADSTEAETAARSELATLKDELKELEAAPRPKTARARLTRTADMEELETDIIALEEKLARLSAPSPREGILPTDPGTDMVAWWKAADIRRQRAVAALLLAPDVLGQVRVKRAPNRKPQPVTERLRWVQA